MTLVMLAAAGGQDDLLRLLIGKGARVNGRQRNGATALIHAAEKNFLTTVAILLEAGAFVNVQQSNGETALMKVRGPRAGSTEGRKGHQSPPGRAPRGGWAGVVWTGTEAQAGSRRVVSGASSQPWVPVCVDGAGTQSA